jgi:hypothetical protein
MQSAMVAHHASGNYPVNSRRQFVINSVNALNEARLKIEWANQHISNTKATVQRLTDSDTSIIHINPETGNEVIEHTIDTKLLNDVALITGDATPQS